MIKIIRDDVIKLESYVVAAFKYDEILTTICEVGGYCLFSQLKEKYGESKAKRIVTELEQYKLISTEYYSNAKYIYITQNALKYLANKENTSNIINNKLKNIDKMPAEKVLIQSILRYQIEPVIKYVNRENYIKLLREKLLKVKNIRLNDIEKIKDNKEKYKNKKDDLIKFIEIIENCSNSESVKDIINKSKHQYNENIKKYDEVIKVIEKENECIKEIIKQSLKLFDLQKIILFPENKETLIMIIVDYSQVKPIKNYNEDIKNFEILIKHRFDKIKISYITYSKERYEKVIKRFKNYITDKNIERFEFIEFEQCYKLQKIIERTYRDDKKEIKKKDIKKFKKIKEQLNKEIGENQ